jgi:hypothetical protein
MDRRVNKPIVHRSYLWKQNQLPFELFTRIVLRFRSYEITSEPFKRPPRRLNAPPYAQHPPALLNAPAATARAAGTHFKTGLAKRCPRPCCVDVAAQSSGPGA